MENDEKTAESLRILAMIDSPEGRERAARLADEYLKNRLREAAFCYRVQPEAPPPTRWESIKMRLWRAWASFVKRYICPCRHEGDPDE